MSRFLKIKDDYISIDIVPKNVIVMYKNSNTDLDFTIEIVLNGPVELSLAYKSEENRDEAYEEIKSLIEELTE